MADKSVKTGEAFGILIGLAAGASLTDAMVESDPERLAPQRARERDAFDAVEEFLQFHLYGSCGRCA